MITRDVTRFLWFPRRLPTLVPIEDARGPCGKVQGPLEWRWLRKATWTQYRYVGSPGIPSRWVDLQWADEEAGPRPVYPALEAAAIGMCLTAAALGILAVVIALVKFS